MDLQFNIILHSKMGLLNILYRFVGRISTLFYILISFNKSRVAFLRVLAASALKNADSINEMVLLHFTHYLILQKSAIPHNGFNDIWVQLATANHTQFAYHSIGHSE